MNSFKQRRLEKELRKQEERRKQRNAIFILIAMMFASFVACFLGSRSEPQDRDSQAAYTEIVEDISPDEETEDDKTTDSAQTKTKNEEKTEDVEQFDASAVPAYSGKAYTAINNNVPFSLKRICRKQPIPTKATLISIVWADAGCVQPVSEQTLCQRRKEEISDR